MGLCEDPFNLIPPSLPGGLLLVDPLGDQVA